MAVKVDLEQINGSCKTEISKTQTQIIIGLSRWLLVCGLGFTSKLDIGLCFSLGFCPGERREGGGGVTLCDTLDLI